MEKYVDINHKTVIEWYANLRAERAKFLMEDQMTKIPKGQRPPGSVGLLNGGEKKTESYFLRCDEEKQRRTPLITVAKLTRIAREHTQLYSPRDTVIGQCESLEFKASDVTCTNEIEGIWSLVK